jgi:putative ABC transport system substrate-binding protein
MKKIAAVLGIIMILCLVIACQNNKSQNSNEKQLLIGVLQFGSHPSLDNCYEGINEGLSALSQKYTIDLQDGNFDSATCDTIAKNMVAKNYDIIFAIATPAAISAYAATANSDIPVIFCAVSDPIAAGLVDDPLLPGGHCTGTSDLLDLESQIQLITALQADVKSIGVLYTTSEANSISQLQKLREIIKPYGLSLVEQGVQGAADIPQAAATLASKVDCITNFTDNNVVNNLQVLLEKASSAGIPVYGSEVEQVKNGCLAAASIDYVALGRETAKLGVRVLLGESTSKIPVSYISESTPVINSDVVKQFAITVPEAYSSAEFVTTTQE